jgi:hypothetical protein
MTLSRALSSVARRLGCRTIREAADRHWREATLQCQRDGAERLAEQEAEEEVSEPTNDITEALRAFERGEGVSADWLLSDDDGLAVSDRLDLIDAKLEDIRNMLLHNDNDSDRMSP